MRDGKEEVNVAKGLEGECYKEAVYEQGELKTCYGYPLQGSCQKECDIRSIDKGNIYLIVIIANRNLTSFISHIM